MACAIGASLVPFGITNALADAFLQLVHSSDQARIAVNNNWGDDAQWSRSYRGSVSTDIEF